MPLPLPDLDDRAWSDLVDEARSLIPRLAPGWTDYNASDPGITVLDLLAWITEADVFGVNRIPRAHRRRFVALADVALAPTRPAVTPVRFATADGAPLRLPRGVVVAASQPGLAEAVPHQLRVCEQAGSPTPAYALTVLGCALESVQAWTGSSYVDRTPDWRRGVSFDATGPDPAGPVSGVDPTAGAALLLGFDAATAVDPTARLSLWLGLDDDATTGPDIGWAERSAPRTHHGVATGWEYHDGTGWQPFAAADVIDETSALTRSGRVVLPFGAIGTVAATVGAVLTPHRWVRVRMTAGRPDVPPRIHAIAADAAPVVQAAVGCATWSLAEGHDPLPGWLTVGATARFGVRTDAGGRIIGFDDPAVEDPEALVVSLPAAGLDLVGLSLLPGGVTDGAPTFSARVHGAPFTGADTAIWLATDRGVTAWQAVDDLLRSRPDDRHVAFDPAVGQLLFGDGRQGLVPPPGSTILVRAERTLGVSGTPSVRSDWRLATDDPHTRALTASAPIPAGDLLIWPVLRQPPQAGVAGRPATAAENLETGEGRAAARMWAHERLLELAPPIDGASLDQLDRATVWSRPSPQRAATTVDFERLAVAVPGTAVRRARAWSGLDPARPGASAPGTVTVVVVPGLPDKRPVPTAGLLHRVRQYLCPRRTLGTRLVVAGPDYLEVSVQATVRVQANVDPQRVRADALARLDAYLHPLTGGPAGQGWPFGRDVYQADILRELDLVDGIDHVDQLELAAGGAAPGCGNICVGPLQLVVSGTHQVGVS